MLACIPNIGPNQRRRRLTLGAAGLAVAAAFAIAFAVAGTPTVLRAIVFVPLYSAAIGFFQYREKT